MSTPEGAKRPVAPRRQRREQGQLALLAFFAAMALLYFIDAARQSFRVDNLSVIGPVTILVLLICGRLAWNLLRKPREPEGTESAEPTDQGFMVQYRAPLFALLLVAYLLGLVYWVFDVSTFLFVLAALWLQGERNGVVMIVFSALFAGLVCWTLRIMVSFPFETLVIPGGG